MKSTAATKRFIKFASLTVILGCSAIVIGMAAQSEPLHFDSALEAPAAHSVSGLFSIGLPQAIQSDFHKVEGFIGPKKPVQLAANEVMKLIAISARRHNVPAAFVSSIVAAESNFNSEVRSPKGAIGLMQLMPATAKEYGANPALPAQNVDAGTRYLRVLLDRYRGEKNQLTHAIAAYNAGPGMVQKYKGVPPFQETRNYVVRVMAFFHHFGGSEKMAFRE